MVDDPYTFGQIAAANALSDVYAMGGEPKIALNIVCFPNCLDPEILSEILRGGADKVLEAGAVLCGGHSVQDDEPKYGLSVTGFVHPDRIYRNYGCRPGDVLILTKQIGSGVVNTAVKAQMASPEAEKEAVRVMSSLNKKAKQAAENITVHACTDVTGFGLLGHCMEMARARSVTLDIHTRDVAYMKEAPDYARMGLVPEERTGTESMQETAWIQEMWRRYGLTCSAIPRLPEAFCSVCLKRKEKSFSAVLNRPGWKPKFPSSDVFWKSRMCLSDWCSRRMQFCPVLLTGITILSAGREQTVCGRQICRCIKL